MCMINPGLEFIVEDRKRYIIFNNSFSFGVLDGEVDVFARGFKYFKLWTENFEKPQYSWLPQVVIFKICSVLELTA
ncbi:unnamed protein product [Candida parapsilosis]